MKITAKILILMFEAYRRLEMMSPHERSKPMTQRWVGCGTYVAYRAAIEAGLMKFHDGGTPPPRCMGWLVLTDEGVARLWDMRKSLEEQYQRLCQSTAYKDSLISQYTLAGGIQAG